MHKIKSVKLWLMLGLIAFVGLLTYHGSVEGGQYIDFIKWLFGLYVAGNVGTKAAEKVNVTPKIEEK